MKKNYTPVRDYLLKKQVLFTTPYVIQPDGTEGYKTDAGIIERSEFEKPFDISGLSRLNPKGENCDTTKRWMQ